MKITIIGGGSYSWTPAIVNDLMSNGFFKNTLICLMDISPKPLEDLYQLCSLLQKARPDSNISFSKTTDLRSALEGSSYVIAAISHGGLEAELEDHRIARKYGFYNMKGSEAGIAGCSRTLRHVPEFIRLAREMEKYCPQAMLLNVTNPLTAITRSVNRYTSIKAVGFCHGVINHLGMLFPFFGAESWEGVDFTVGGVDHCSWLLDVKYRGKDALEILKGKGLIEAAKRGESIATYDDPFAGRENQRCRFLLWDILGYMPAISDEHCIEFFGQIMGSEEKRKYYGVTYDRIAERTKTVHRAKDEVAAVLKGEIPPLSLHSGEILDKFIAALNGGESFIDVLNYPNLGQIPNLPFGTVVETKCLVDSGGVHPVLCGNLPPVVESIVRPLAIREELYMEAAAENDIRKLKSALSCDPIVNDFRKIDEICSELMNYNNRFRA